MDCVNPHALSSEATARVRKIQTQCRMGEDCQYWQPHMGRGDSHEQKQVRATIRGRLHVAGVSLPISDKDIETGILNQNKMTS